MNSQVILELLRSTLCFWFLTNFLIFWPALRHQGWCQNIAQRSPTLFGKTSFFTHTFLEHVRSMSKKYISYIIIPRHIICSRESSLKVYLKTKNEKCINRCENRALNLIISANDFKYDSGASEKHFISLIFGRLFIFFDRLLDTRDDAKT